MVPDQDMERYFFWSVIVTPQTPVHIDLDCRVAKCVSEVPHTRAEAREDGALCRKEQTRPEGIEKN